MKNSVNSSLAHRQAVCNLPSGYSKIFRHKGVHCNNLFLSDDHLCLTWSWHVHCTHTSMMKITTPSENCSTWHTLSPIHILHSTVNVGSTNTFCRQKLDYCALSLFGGIHGTIINCYLAQKLSLSSSYHCMALTAIFWQHQCTVTKMLHCKVSFVCSKVIFSTRYFFAFQRVCAWDLYLWFPVLSLVGQKGVLA